MNKFKDIFVWDKYSDQPHVMKDKKYKKDMRKKHSKDYMIMFLYNLIIFPLALFCSLIFKSKQEKFPNFFSMCVNLDKGEKQIALIEELGCNSIQIRMPLIEISRLDEYVEFAKKFKNKDILINILQDRANIEDKVMLRENLTLIFSAFKGVSSTFQIGNAINRTKWGFFSIGEYLEFYKIAQNIRDEDYKDYLLVGPSVIDYEYHYTIRALFNKHNIKYDKVSSLLYVDRRGAPENTQMGIFDLSKKIDFLYSLCRLSLRSTADILITETNWPISNTAPWAPTSENECVSEEDYTNYMLRYYFLALASRKIQKVYWHQLIAPGYGLIDSRESFRKRSAFEAYKTMIAFVQDCEVIKYSNAKDLHVLTCKKNKRTFDILWVSGDRVIPLEVQDEVYDKLANKLEGEIKITNSPIYAYHKRKYQ